MRVCRSFHPFAFAFLAACGACGSSHASPSADSPDAAPSDAFAPPADSSADAPVDAGPAPDPTGWKAAASMRIPRSSHTATRLPDGRVLVVGGEADTRQMLVSVETYDPVANTWTELSPLPAPRSNHAAVALPDGRVLIIGGGQNDSIGQPSGNQVTASCLLFDPTTNTFTPTGSLHDPRMTFGAARLASGDVLVVGGATEGTDASCGGVPNCGSLGTALATAELYRPSSGTWTRVGSLQTARFSFSTTLLANGKVLAAGGVDQTQTGFDSAEIYDPSTQAWSEAPAMPAPAREHQSAILLSSGRVLVAGGKNPNVAFLSSVLLFDPTANAWSNGPSLPVAMTGLGLVVLSSGRTLMAGGYSELEQKAFGESQIFEEPADTWKAIGALHTPRLDETLTLLEDGTVLAVGGFTAIDVTATCERSTPGP